MKILNLNDNNIFNLTTEIDDCSSIGIGGLSGSGKSTFCNAIYNESIHRIVSLLPKTEYRFLFPEQLATNCSANHIQNMPLVYYFRRNGFSNNPRSTLGTHSGLFKKIRLYFAGVHNKSSEFFSFNNSLMWCPKCKGRGSTSGITCNFCNGERFDQSIYEYSLNINGTNMCIVDVNKMTIQKLMNCAYSLNLDDNDIGLINNLIKLGLPYLSLDRIMGTLSGGETIRVFLAEFMSSCENALLILDEISTGLDKSSLLSVLTELGSLAANNQVWFIDHSDEVLYSNGQQLYFGPGSGNKGGKIVSNSPRPQAIIPDHKTPEDEDYFIFKKLKKRNINLSELKIPKKRITVITGKSGCGKSTLVHECILPYLKKYYKNVKAIVIGQDRNQSITSKSTISTFLGLKKELNKYDELIEHTPIEDIVDIIKKDKKIHQKIKSLLELGLGYLSLDRKVQSLSTGEFQSICLIEQLSPSFNKKTFEEEEKLIILDEPSKGLSQNILNLFMSKIRSILNDENNVTFLIIEHNQYIIECSDFVIDFLRISEEVRKLELTSIEKWKSAQIVPDFSKCRIPNKCTLLNSGIVKITQDADSEFEKYNLYYKGGLLKNFSSTAQWIYRDYNIDKIMPTIAIDLESNLYSKNTFLFEICSIINSLVEQGKTKRIDLFDFYNPDNLCECCRGTGKIFSFDYSSIIKDERSGFWDGLFQDDIMQELKNYNFAKIKFLFKEIKKTTKIDLSIPFISMNKDEKRMFLYGYWKESFYDTSKKTQRKWQGIIHLINKYMRSSASKYKKIIQDSKYEIICPICNGSILKTDQVIKFQSNVSLTELLLNPIKSNLPIFMNIDALKDILGVVGTDISLSTDVSNFDLSIQVYLKLMEIKYSSFYGFTIVLKNFAPFKEQYSSIVEEISKNNKVILIDWDEIPVTKDALLEKLYSLYKLKAESYGYEILGYKKISTSINTVKRNNPCPYCKGKGIFRDESIFDGVDVTETPCTACKMTGISDLGKNELIEGVPVSVWLEGRFSDINCNIDSRISELPLYCRIKELNKHQINNIVEYMEE